jgi:hypothetical protein
MAARAYGDNALSMVFAHRIWRNVCGWQRAHTFEKLSVSSRLGDLRQHLPGRRVLRNP